MKRVTSSMRRIVCAAASVALALSLVPAAAVSALAEEAPAGTGSTETSEQPAQPAPEQPTLVTDPSQAQPAVSLSCSWEKGSWAKAKTVSAGVTKSFAKSNGKLQRIRASISLPKQELADGVTYTTGIEYRVMTGGSWGDWVKGDKAAAGVSGKAAQKIAIRLDPTTTVAEHYTLAYRVTLKGCSQLAWTNNSADAEELFASTGAQADGYAISGLELTLVPKGSEPAAGNVPAAISDNSFSASYKLKTTSSIDTASKLGSTAGSASKSAKNGVRIAASSDSELAGSISYKVYQKGKGWSASAKQGAYAGSSSSKAYLMGIKMYRSSQLKDFADLYYRVYLKGYGWMGWAKNGELAGTTSYEGFPVSAYQVKLVPKGAAAPGKTANASSGKEGVLKEPAIAKRMQAKAKNMSSKTSYLLMTDTTYCRTAVFTGSKGNWTLKYLWKAGPGATWSPTPKGTYTTTSHVPVFGWEKGYNCWYGTCFDEGREILFHSEVYNIGSKTQMQSGGLGTRVSHGCVRLALKNAKWIYQNVPLGTKVLIF